MKVDLSTRDGYILATALRGPDLNYPTLKYIITGWIRAQCGVTYKDCLIRTEPLTNNNLERAKKEVDTIYRSNALLHWLSHSYQALRLLPAIYHQTWLLSFIDRLTRLSHNPSEENKQAVYEKLEMYRTPE